MVMMVGNVLLKNQTVTNKIQEDSTLLLLQCLVTYKRKIFKKPQMLNIVQHNRNNVELVSRKRVYNERLDEH